MAEAAKCARVCLAFPEEADTDAGLPPARGQTYRLPAGTFFALRDGRRARVTTCYNLADWSAQVGAEA